MLVATLLLAAGIQLVIGATLCAFAKSGPQETLGGVIVMVGVLVLLAGGLLWSIGL